MRFSKNIKTSVSIYCIKPRKHCVCGVFDFCCCRVEDALKCYTDLFKLNLKAAPVKRNIVFGDSFAGRIELKT